MLIRNRFPMLMLLTALVPSAARAAEPASRPNLVLVLCDDLGYSDFGCYGGEIRTPNIDRLASQGLRFTQFYNCAVCVLTRSALLTGLHPRQGPAGLLRPGMTTLGEVLSAAGYETSLSGKWHVGAAGYTHPNDYGFADYFGLLGGASNHWSPIEPDPAFYGGTRRRWFQNRELITTRPAGFYSTDAITDHAVQNIRKFATANAPFFVHVCYTAPHVPLHAPPEDVARYRGKYNDGYYELRQRRHRRQLELGIVDPRWKLSPVDERCGPSRQDFALPPWDEVDDQPRERARMEVYAAMIDRIDQSVGRLLAALNAAGVEQNTLVMVLSDNGGCASLPVDMAGLKTYNGDRMPGGFETYDYLGPGWGWAVNTPFRRHKTWNYEGGIATPLIARWPGMIMPGSITHEVGHVVDFMPTFLELAGGAYPAGRDGQPVTPHEGQNLLPVLRGGTRPGHDTLCWALYGNRAIRQGGWKLTWGHTRRAWELYDLQTDRTETHDLAAQYPGRVASMSAAWQTFATATEVGVPGSRYSDLQNDRIQDNSEPPKKP
jgi:arylsulfatase